MGRAAVLVYTIVSIFCTFVIFANYLGLNRVLAYMVHRGMLHSDRAAPRGALEKHTEVVSFIDASSEQECCVCLEKYRDGAEIVRTKACQHVFHKRCLQGWLNVNGNCPLCRHD